MVERISKLGDRRYVGDKANKIAHDRWHADSQGCGLGEIVRRGDAVGFEPDTLDGALWAGYEYCEACHDKSEPTPPGWGGFSSSDDGSERDDPPSAPLLRGQGHGEHEAAELRVKLMEVRG